MNDVSGEVRKYFKETGFHSSDVSVMSGEDEGISVWRTVNFLLGNLGTEKKQTAGIIDMSGLSTQIVFEPTGGMSNAPKQNAKGVWNAGRQHKLYQHSHLGFGLQEALKAMKARKACPTAEFEKCVQGAKMVLNKNETCPKQPCSFNGVFQPPLTANFAGELYASSYYPVVMEKVLPKDGKQTVGDIMKYGKKVCTDRSSHSRIHECMELVWLYTVLSHGYSLSDAAKLNIRKKINGVETAWPLGAMLELLEKE